MFQYLITAVLLWALWASPLGKARKTGLVLLVLAIVFSLWTTVEYFITCAEASEKVQGNATSFKAKLQSLLGYRTASKPKAITKSEDFKTRIKSYTAVNNDLKGIPGRITANCATYKENEKEKILNDYVKNSDSNVSDITKYDSKVAKAK